MVCKFLKLDCVYEVDKRHPADFFNVGRIRVRLFDDDKKPVNPEISSKKVLMAKMGELIPNLKTRVQPSTEKSGGKGQKSSSKKAQPKKQPPKNKKKK